MRRYIPGLAEWNARNRRARAEYKALPISSSTSIAAPCIRDGCTRTAKTHRGVCRACLAREEKP